MNIILNKKFLMIIFINNLQILLFKYLSKIDKKLENFNSTIFEGWIKLKEINENFPNVTEFKKNKMFDLQMSDNKGMDPLIKDFNGYIHIPNEKFYYAQLTKKKLIIYSSRHPRYKKFQQSLNISQIIPQSMGGIEEFVNSESEFCFLIKFNDHSFYFIWEVCTESLIEKIKWMNKLIEMNIKDKILNNYNGFYKTLITVPPPQALKPIRSLFDSHFIF